MSYWQSTILMLYYRERVTFALPCVLPVRPIYGPIMCNMLKCCVGSLRICTTIVLSQESSSTLPWLSRHKKHAMMCVSRRSLIRWPSCLCAWLCKLYFGPHGIFYLEQWLHSRIFLCLHCKNIACFNPLMVVRVAIIY